MRILFISAIFILLSSIVFSQVEKDPLLGELLDLSLEGEQSFLAFEKRCDAFIESKNDDFNNLNEAEIAFRDSCFESKESYWDNMEIGCSWYCGGGPDSISASSELDAVKEINYTANNIHDFNLKTAWIEGAKGYGIGESITYHFAPQAPRITQFIIINGYVKSEKAWRANSRVKKLKVYYKDAELAILNLNDSKHEQIFKFDPLGNSERDDSDKLIELPPWTLRFEIMEVYEGEEYDDTVITEIYFDGIDVH